jgi:hypothetical protein
VPPFRELTAPRPPPADMRITALHEGLLKAWFSSRSHRLPFGIRRGKCHYQSSLGTGASSVCLRALNRSTQSR